MGNVLSALTRERIPLDHNAHDERRKRERLKLSLPVHVRPLARSEQQIEEVAITLNITRHGLCFSTSRNHYYLGMSLFVTFPYSAVSLVRKEYVAEVVRVDPLPSGNQAVAVQFLS